MSRSGSFTVGKAPGALPLAGHMRPLLRDPLGFLSSLSGHGDLVWIKLGPVRALVVCHPELVRELLLRDRDFDKGGAFFDRAREFVGNGLITCRRSDHRRQRRMMQPAFHPDRLRGYAEVMTEQIGAATAGWHDGQIIDAYTDMHAISSRTASLIMFGSNLSASRIQRFHEALCEILEVCYRQMLTPPVLDRLPTPSKRRYDRARACLREVTGQFIEDYQDADDRHDLMSMLLGYRDDEGRALSADEICDQVATLFLAGTETTASNLGWALYLLAQHPELQDKLRAETQAVLGDRIATWDDLPRLAYAGRVITEALRLFPPAWLLTRRTSHDTVLGDCHIPAGTTMVYSAYQLHHRADLSADPGRFDPDRWNDVRPPRGALVPFGSGSRKCIGDSHGMMQNTLALASIVSRWRLTPASGIAHPVPRMTLAPRHVQLRLSAVTAAVAGPAEPSVATRTPTDERCPMHDLAGTQQLAV
jgi:cytochrome P450